MKTTSLSALTAVILTLPTLLFAQETQEDEDLELLRENLELLKEAKLSDELEDRRLLQDLDLSELPKAEEVIEEAKARVRELQKNGFLVKEAIDATAAVAGNSATEEAKTSASDILGPPPEKAPTGPLEKQPGMLYLDHSQTGTGSLEEGILVYEGDVVVTSDEFTLRCDKLEVFLDELKNLKRAIATGRMVVIEASNDDGPIEARCQLAVYEADKDDPEKSVMYLRIWPEIKMPPSRLVTAQEKKAYVKLIVDDDGNMRHELNGKFSGSGRKPANPGAATP